MTTTYGTPRKSRKWTKRQIAIASVAGAVLVAPGVAYAAVQIFGFGSIAGAAPANPTLTIEDATYPTEVGVLAPGGKANVKIAVKNPNSFAVDVKSLHIKNGFTVNGGTAGQCDITATGASASFPEQGGGSKKTTLTSPVTLNPGQVTYIDFPEVFSQAATATKLCSVSGQYAVEGSVGN